MDRTVLNPGRLAVAALGAVMAASLPLRALAELPASTNVTLLSAQFSKKLEISATVYNLFDHRYSDPVGLDLPEEFVQQNGRTFRVKLTYRF